MLVKDKAQLKSLINNQFKGTKPKYIINDYTTSIFSNAGKFEHSLLLLGSNIDPLSKAKELKEFFNNCKRLFNRFTY